MIVNTANVVLRSVEGNGLVFAVHAGNGGEFVMDSARQPQGASPVEALLAALGGCCGMDVIGILRKQRQVVLGYEVEVVGARLDEHPRRFTRIEVVHRVRGRDLDPRAIEEAIRLSDTKYCTVYATLAPAVELVSRFEIIPA